MRLPDLGPRGEGWVIVQFGPFAVIAVAGFLGPAWDGPMRIGSTIAAVLLAAGGALLVGRAVRALGPSVTPMPRPRDDARFVRTGAYRLVRHPIYGGVILLAVAWGLAMASPPALAASLLLTVFFDAKSRREEAWLVEKFPEYEAYRRRTRRLLPWLY